MSAAAAWQRALATAVAVAALDQLTKALARATLEPGTAVAVVPGLELSLVRNTGIAFGALSEAGGAIVVALTVAALGLLLWLFASRPTRRLLWLPVGMVLGGAVGNLIDRARLGGVTDFIDPAWWPAFNLADTAIVVGVFGVVLAIEGRGERRREAPA